MRELTQVGMGAVAGICDSIAKELLQKKGHDPHWAGQTIYIYGVPRGGVYAAQALAYAFLKQGVEAIMTTQPGMAHVIVDDIIDSGATRDRFAALYNAPFVALYDVSKIPHADRSWMVFPWEHTDPTKGDAPVETVEDNIVRLLQFVGENPQRGGLLETPRRVTKAWKEWCSGYELNAKDILKTFEDGAENCDSMVVVKDIPLYSHCEHHLAAIFGTVTIGYIPNGKIVGLSKLSRLADMFARRLQVQERLTNQIADALTEHLQPKGVGVLIRARHLCMESRGVCQQGHHTITTALRGAMLDEGSARAEFLEAAR